MVLTNDCRLDLQDQRLKYLYLSYQLGSMRAAADELGMAASSVSRQIGKLEAELDVDLVEQGTHKIRLTEAGQAAIDYYRARALQFDALLGRLDDLRGRYLGTTVIAVGEGLLGSRAIGELEAFFQNHPNTHTEIIIAPSFEVQRMILEDQAHIGVVFAPQPTSGLRSLYRFPQPMRAVMHPESPLAAKPSVSLEDLANSAIVLPGPKFRVRELADRAGRGTPFSIKPSITSNSLQVILDFVRSKIAITLLAELPIFSELQSGAIKAVPIDHEEMSNTDIQIVVRQSRKLSPTARDLIHHLARTIKQLRKTAGLVDA